MKLVDLKKIHEGKYLSYYIATYKLQNDSLKEYEFVSRRKDLNADTFSKNKSCGVGMIAFSLDKSRILLEKEFRMACNDYVYNFPTGLIDQGEDVIDAAKRELFEETGLELVKIEKVLPSSYASAPTTDEVANVVICYAKGELKDSTFIDEEITTRWYTKEEIKDLLEKSENMSSRTQMVLWMWANS